MNKEQFFGMESKPETPKVGVGVVIRNNDNCVLVGLRKNSHGAGLWSFPGGHMELGESFLDVCKREVFEETGINIYGVDKLAFTNDIFANEGLHYITLFFTGHWDGLQDVINKEPDKTEEWRWIREEHLYVLNFFPPAKQILCSLYSIYNF